MRILITNDDGISAPGLEVLHQIATDLAGPEGEVWTVAPAFEQSGVAHAISYTRPLMVSEISPRRWAAEGTPADCVLAALGHILPGPPDLVLSGVNRGNNAGENAVYSGTLGAAMEAAIHGCRAVALSQFYGPDNRSLPDPFEAARVHGARVIERLLAEPDWTADTGYTTFYNVNFPPCPADAVAGVAACAQGLRPTSRFGVEAAVAPNGRQFLWVRGGRQDEPSAHGTDVALNLENRVTVTPMRADLTAPEAIDRLTRRLTEMP